MARAECAILPTREQGDAPYDQQSIMDDLESLDPEERAAILVIVRRLAASRRGDGSS